MRQHGSFSARDGVVPVVSGFVRPRGASTELQAGFEERAQQLSIRGHAGNAVTAVFDYELKNYNVLEADYVAKMLGSSVAAGLSAAAAADGLKKNGHNVISPPREWPLPAKFVFAMFNGFAPILWIAALLCFIAWQPLGGSNPSPYNLGLAILLLVIIFLGGIFVFWQEFQTARILAGFKSLIPDVAVAIRDGVAVSVPSAELTVGDIVQLQTGMKIPADVRVASVSSLRVDNSMLTGEAEPVRLFSDPTSKEITTLAAHNMAFMGSTVAQGSGTGIVVAVGDKCQIGCIVKLASTPPKVSSLQRELNIFVLIIAGFAVFFFTLVLIVWGASINPRHPTFMPTPVAVANALGVLVALVPEGLPLALAAGLTVIAKRLCDKHFVLLKQLVTVETLGSMSLLASDKTGTLTQNLMSVVNVVTGTTGETLGVAEAAARVAKSSTSIAALARCASLCNDASIQAAAPLPTPALPVASSAVAIAIAPTPAPVIVGGNGTDKALLSWAASLGQGAEARDAFVPVHAIPFSSVTKQAVAVQTGATDGASIVFVKGAPDALLPRCTHFATEAADPAPLTDTARAAFEKALDTLGRQGKRVLALCERSLPRDSFPPGFAFSSDPEPNFPLDGLTLLGLVAIADPPRLSTAPAVAALRIAGIHVAMVTGDAETTAEAIARQVGIITLPIVHRPGSSIWASDKALSDAAADESAAVVVTGPELARFTPADWEWLLRHPEIVLARTTPEQKLAFVQAAQKAGHRVGVTGDGMNDAPALRNADIGVAMNSGSDAARDAAHVVLLKDDFAALVHAAREGRLIFANLRKVCAYLITGGCWSELLPVLANFFLGMPTLLSAFLMIYISCVTDVCASIALIYEEPEGAIMQGAPRDHRKSKLVDVQLVLNQYLFYGMMISFATFFNTLYYLAGRAGSNGPTMVSSSSSDSSDTVLNYPPSKLLFAWGWISDVDQLQAINTASSIFFITIIVGQLGNYMSTRRRCSPYFSDFKCGATFVDFLRNLTVYLTPTIPIVCTFVLEIVFAIIIIETPGAQNTFSTAHVPGQNWGIAIGFSLAAFTISEAGKWWIHFHPTSILCALFWK